MATTTKPKEGNDASELVPIHKMSKATPSNEAPESSAQAATRDSSGKTPYCYRCLTKGHVREDCDAEMYCDICDCIEHFTSRCPKFRGDKPCAIPCGYAVEGLGFYHIPQSVTPQQRSDPRAAVIRVTDGTLTIPNVISELERLIPGKWKWNVESGGNSNTFKTLFPSKTELKRMAEWGVVQTKFNNAKLKIEERPLGDKAKFALPKIWVQFTGLPNDLHDFLTIWAIGSILGVTKAVDMRFTRQHAVCRLQILVLDPNLIPQFVDIVIGDYLYELQFMVEINGDANNPEPMDMDHHGKEDGDNNKGTRENNKAPGTQQGAANGKEAKESRNNSDALVLPGGTLILILIGVTAW